MPAAAVIPAPIAYIKVVAVKKLVVYKHGRRPQRKQPAAPIISYCEQNRVFKASRKALNKLAWNNRGEFFVGLEFPKSYRDSRGH